MQRKNSSRNFYILLVLIAALTLPLFCYKAVYAPVKFVSDLKETFIRYGDFWGHFPGAFVDQYNPELRGKTVSKMRWSGKSWGYGPVYNMVTLPLTLFKSIKLVSAIWLAVNYIFLFLAILLAWKILNGIPILYKTMIIMLLLGYWPLYIAIQEDVIEILEFLLIWLSLYFLYRSKNTLSGISMGFACMTKFLPVIFLIYFLVKGKIKAFFAMLITIAVIVVVTQFTLGWQNSTTLDFFRYELGDGSCSVATLFRSQSINSVIARLSVDTDPATSDISIPKNPCMVKTITIFAVLICMSLAFFAIYGNRKKGEYGLEYGIVASVMILASMHSHPYYLIFNLIGYTFALASLCKRRYDFGMAITAISYFISGYINQIGWFEDLMISKYLIADRHVFFYLLSFPAYGSILLFVALIMIYLRATKDATVYRN